MNLIQLLDKDRNRIDVKKYGLIGLGLSIPSPSYSSTTERITGRPGEIPMGKDLDPRNLTARFVSEAHDYNDSLLLRDELYKMFSQVAYIGEVKQPGKWWNVEFLSEWDPERLNIYAHSFEVPFIAYSGMAESLGRTTDPFEWDADLWQWGMGIPYDDYKYEHTTSNFTIYNAGTETIDPRFNDLVITIEAVTPDYIEIVNNTTGETYRYDGSLTSNDTLIIDGIRSTKNSLSVFRDTNKKLLTLLPGANDIEVKGATVERILFDFRFLYL